MIRFALFDYIPQRFLNRATFEEIDLHRRILDFKDGKGYATRWASKEMGYALSDMDLSDTYIVCIPACCKRTHDRRYKEFIKMVCEWCGARNSTGHPRKVRPRPLQVGKGRIPRTQRD